MKTLIKRGKELTIRYTREAVGSLKPNPNKVPSVQESLKKMK